MAKPKSSDKEKSRETLGSESGESPQGVTKKDGEINGAPAIISERAKSERPKPPESQDVEYLSYREISLGKRVSTLDMINIEDPAADYETHPGPWIERCKGVNPETHKMQVYRIPAKQIKVLPEQVMQYLGSVIKDHQAVHTVTLSIRHRRTGYCFDHFFIHNGKRLARCCYVPDRNHQAGLMYEKRIDRQTRKPFAIIRRIKGSKDEPAYQVVGLKSEPDYRELKRLYERHFMRTGDEILADDIGLKYLIGT